MPGTLRSPDRPEPCGAVASDQADVGKRLDVLHERRPPSDSLVANGAYPGEGRRGRLTPDDRADHRRLLSGEEPVGRHHDLEAAPVVLELAGARRARGAVTAPTPRERGDRPARHRASAPRPRRRRARGGGPARGGSGPCRSPARSRRRWPPRPVRAGRSAGSIATCVATGNQAPPCPRTPLRSSSSRKLRPFQVGRAPHRSR